MSLARQQREVQEPESVPAVGEELLRRGAGHPHRRQRAADICQEKQVSVLYVLCVWQQVEKINGRASVYSSDSPLQNSGNSIGGVGIGGAPAAAAAATRESKEVRLSCVR